MFLRRIVPGLLVVYSNLAQRAAKWLEQKASGIVKAGSYAELLGDVRYAAGRCSD